MATRLSSSPMNMPPTGVSERELNETVDVLKDMFTEYDREVILAVAEAHGGDLEKTLAALLMMVEESSASSTVSGTTVASSTASAYLPDDFLSFSSPTRADTSLERRDHAAIATTTAPATAIPDSQDAPTGMTDYEFALYLQQQEYVAAQQAAAAAGGGARSRTSRPSPPRTATAPMASSAADGAAQSKTFKERWNTFSENTKRKFRELMANRQQKKKGPEYVPVNTEMEEEMVPLHLDDANDMNVHGHNSALSSDNAYAAFHEDEDEDEDAPLGSSLPPRRPA